MLGPAQHESRLRCFRRIRLLMRLLCALGRHRPEPWPRWNAGYYFARCKRCGRDLVRTAYGDWGIPKGCRVVWQTTPPENAVTAYLAADTEAAHAAFSSTRPTIEEVLRTLGPGIPPDIEPGRAPDSTTDTAEAHAEPAAQDEIWVPIPHAEANAEPPAPNRREDFMDDDNDALWEEFWDGGAGAGPARADAPSPSMTSRVGSMAALGEQPRSSKATRS